MVNPIAMAIKTKTKGAVFIPIKGGGVDMFSVSKMMIEFDD